MAASEDTYDPFCTLCPRLADHLRSVTLEHPSYHCSPVPAFGDDTPRLLIVGLAPGKHGANATGRPFTGDFAGILLYRTLWELGLGTQPESFRADDPLELLGCRITNAVKCLPPQNKPTSAEVRNCNRYLVREIELLAPQAVVLALGQIAHQAVVRACGDRISAHRFAHGAEHVLGNGRRLIDSYHCSRYNTQTGRLTDDMFRAVVARAAELAGIRTAQGT